jgi:hypothetical protein
VGVDCWIVILPKSTSSSANLKIIPKLPKKAKLSGLISPCRKSSRFSNSSNQILAPQIWLFVVGFCQLFLVAMPRFNKRSNFVEASV